LRVHRFPGGDLLERQSGAQKRAFVVEFAGEQEALGQAFDEAAGNHHLGMAGEVGWEKTRSRAAYEYVPVRHEMTHVAHEDGAGALGADVFDGGDHSGGPKGVGPVTGVLSFELVDAAVTGEVVEGCGGLGDEDDP